MIGVGEAASQQPEAQGAVVTLGDGSRHELCREFKHPTK